MRACQIKSSLSFKDGQICINQQLALMILFIHYLSPFIETCWKSSGEWPPILYLYALLPYTAAISKVSATIPLR